MASEAAAEVVEEVVQAVMDSYELVILLRVKNRPVPSLTLVQAVTAQGLEVMETLEFKDSRGAIVPLTHLKVIKQHVPNLCGYHSLYNVLETVRYLKLKNPERRWKIADSASFWKFHFRTTNFIVEEALRRGNEHYWTVRNARYGDLERCFLKYLLQGNDHIMQHFERTNEFVSQLHTFAYQFNALMLERGEVLKQQESIDFFRTTRTECVLGFMMGVTNHWVSLVAHHIGGYREYFFLDSRNRPYLHFTEEQIVQLYEEIGQERVHLGKKPFTNWELTVAHQGVKDIQQSVRILMSCLVGQTTLPQVVVSCKVQHLLDNFDQMPGDSFLDRLELFFEAGFPAKFIHDDYVVHFLSYPVAALTQENRNRLGAWVRKCDEALRQGFGRSSWEAKFFHQLVINKLRVYLAPHL